MIEFPLLIILLLAWFVLTWLRRPLALALLVVVLPVYQIRFEIFGIPLTVLETLILVLVFAWVLHILVYKKKVRVPHVWMVVAFLLTGAIATAVSVDIRAGLGLLKAYVFEPVLIYLVFVNTITKKQDIRRVQWAIILLVSYVAGAALFQKFGWFAIPEPYASEVPQRATSVYPFPTAIGKLLAPLVAFSLVYVLYARSAFVAGFKKRLLGFSIAGVSGVVSILMSINRGALIGVLVGFGVALFWTKKKVLVATIAAVCVIGALMLPVVQQEIVSVFTREDTSADVRVVLWQGTWRLIQANPITGAGLGGFPTLYDEYRDASHVELFPNPDNLYLTLWAELGIYGALVFIWVCIVWFRESRILIRRAAYGSEQWILGIALIAALVALLAHGFVDTPYFKNDLATLFWVLFGLLVATRNGVPGNVTEKSS